MTCGHVSLKESEDFGWILEGEVEDEDVDEGEGHEW